MNSPDLRQPPATLSHAVILRMVAVLGCVAGVGVTGRQMLITDFPVDMIIYREGVLAFLEGREMYAVPMYAGDLALPFIYPPFGALALVPLSVGEWLTHDLAGDLMIMLSSALVLACLWFVLRAATGARVDRDSLLALTTVTWAGMMLIEPVWLNAGFAQVNIVIMGLVILDLVPRKRFLPQGTLIGIAAAIKISPLAMLLFFLLRRDLKAILTAVVSALAATGIAALIRWDATVEFFSSVLLGMGTESEFGVDSAYQSNSSLKGMIMRWYLTPESLDAHSTQANVIWLVLSLATIILGGWFMIALMRRDMLVDAALVNAVIMLLISPVSWSHHWVWLTLLLPVVAWRCATTLGAPVFLSAWVILWTALVLHEPPKWWYGDSIEVHALTFTEKLLVSDFVWLAIVLLIAWAVALRGVPRATPAAIAA
ncbi:glycosyltransferase family 87 protein [Corynebacterium suedekumii]|uniref:Glycosyltransferase family 87 protein n=1 Tax=Corynebacterium suedekumii TaxID=3049801 RepID=A0ABY8VIU8_9CORY|nr:glycosyltransferase family 87 protein [Corynebacterium suedekumii]WIM69581.1 glycosyltransferase family 87 protein [Corynebacterium suedekumii]